MDNLHCGSCAELLGNASQAARHLSMVEVHHWAWAVENCPLFVFSSSLFPKYYELGSNKMLLWILTLATAPMVWLLLVVLEKVSLLSHLLKSLSRSVSKSILPWQSVTALRVSSSRNEYLTFWKIFQSLLEVFSDMFTLGERGPSPPDNIYGVTSASDRLVKW